MSIRAGHAVGKILVKIRKLRSRGDAQLVKVALEQEEGRQRVSLRNDPVRFDNGPLPREKPRTGASFITLVHRSRCVLRYYIPIRWWRFGTGGTEF